MTFRDLTYPTIHLNGTSADALVDHLATAGHAIRAALDALAATGPNARDYYVQGEGAFESARREHQRRVDALSDVAAELMRLVEYIEEQRDARALSRAQARTP